MAGDQADGAAPARPGGNSFRPIVEFEALLPERHHCLTGQFHKQFVGAAEYVQPDAVDGAQPFSQLRTHTVGVICQTEP